MVSPKDLEKLQLTFDKYCSSESPDMFAFSGDMLDALFEINTLDSFVAGLVTRVLDGKRLSDEEVNSIPKEWLLFKNDELFMNAEKGLVNLSDEPLICGYAEKLDDLIRCLLKAHS